MHYGFYKVIELRSDKSFVDALIKHIDLELLKNEVHKNDYLLYNLLKYDYDGKSLKLGSSKLMKMYLEKENLK